jgi:hypothetical protein
MKNLLKVKSIITLSLTLAVIILSILSVGGAISVANLASNPLIICVISAFTSSYTSLYVRNKDKADDSIISTVNNSEKAMGWTKEDLNQAMTLNASTFPSARDIKTAPTNNQYHLQEVKVDPIFSDEDNSFTVFTNDEFLDKED